MNSNIKNIITQWLDANKNNTDINLIVLCQDTTDIIRYRIFFHEELNISSLLSVNFYTINMWLNKTLPFLTEIQEKVLNNSFLEKIIINNILEKKNLKISLNIFKDIFELSGFKNEIHSLWTNFNWLNPFLKINENTYSKKTQTLLKLFEIINEEIQKLNYLHLPLFLTKAYNLNYKINFEENKKHDVLWILPLEMGYTEKKKLEFLNSICEPSWNIILNNNLTSENNLNKFISSLEKYKVNKFIFELNEHIGSACSIEDNLNLVKFNKEKKKEIKIWKSQTFYAEAHLISETIAYLINNSVSLYDIQISYANDNILDFITYHLNKKNIPYDLKNNISTKTFGYSFFLNILITIFCINTKLKNKINIENILYLIKSPFFNFNYLEKYLYKKNITVDKKYLDPFLWEEVFLKNKNTSDITLPSLIQYLKNKQNTHLEFYYFSLSIELLASEFEKLPNENKPSAYINLFNKIILKYTKREKHLTAELINNYNETIISLNKIFQNLAFLDTIHEKISKHDFFSIMRDELEKLKIKNKINENEHDKWGIVIRHINDGIHSNIKFLFLCDLNFLYKYKQIETGLIDLENKNLINFSKINRKEEQKILSQYIEKIPKAVFFTFSLEDNSFPDWVVFFILKKYFNMDNKSESISLLPLYEKLPDIKASWDLPLQLKNDIKSNFSINFLIENNMSTEDEINKEINYNLYKNFYQIKTNENIKYIEKYFGFISNTLDTKKLINNLSPSAFDILQNCPQKFWYNRLLKIENLNFNNLSLSLPAKEKGSLFHMASQYLINEIMKINKNKSYHTFAVSHSKNQIISLLEDVFKNTVLKINFNSNNINKNNLLIKKDIENQHNLFKKYFLSFFNLVKLEKHPLYEFIPLATEYKFENIKLGPFYFKGSIDRIDFNESSNTYIIIDYKTSKIKPAANLNFLTTLNDIQLAVYIKAAAETFIKEEAIKGKTIFSGTNIYIQNNSVKTLENNIISNKYTIENITRENFLETIKPQLNIINNILEKHYFFAVPHRNKNKSNEEFIYPCRNCEFQLICDGIPFDKAMLRIKNDINLHDYLLKIHNKKYL
ncbi:MAG: PD-(D/E)XK nuclease family protein [Spirochaetia bacterium]|nr:PD-(D/E)XK nuclease family protein [Spirochaetia bacterium]